MSATSYSPSQLTSSLLPSPRAVDGGEQQGHSKAMRRARSPVQRSTSRSAAATLPYRRGGGPPTPAAWESRRGRTKRRRMAPTGRGRMPPSSSMTSSLPSSLQRCQLNDELSSDQSLPNGKKMPMQANSDQQLEQRRT
uniref:Uncharacterized protein n=1 Tax=Oryza glumipatula TaxID=40148 RepID=A0A0E0BVM1_9ORYZ